VIVVIGVFLTLSRKKKGEGFGGMDYMDDYGEEGVSP
jgi:hypothetical protein